MSHHDGCRGDQLNHVNSAINLTISPKNPDLTLDIGAPKSIVLSLVPMMRGAQGLQGEKGETGSATVEWQSVNW